MKPEFKKGIAKWAICCLALLILYCAFDAVGILFAIGLSYVVIRHF